MTEAKALPPSWSRSPAPGLSISTPVPDFALHANLRASAEWDSTSPCADDMQTDSPSSIRTPVPECRHGMEVRWSHEQASPVHSWADRRARCAMFDMVCTRTRADGYLPDAAASRAAVSVEEIPSGRRRTALRRRLRRSVLQNCFLYSQPVLPPEHVCPALETACECLTRTHGLTAAADLIWTSGEHFKFDRVGSDPCDSPTILSGERLSLGMLDLSGTSDSNFCSDAEERLDASAISAHNTENSANTTVQCADHVSNLTASPMCVVHNKGKPSPSLILDNSSHSVNNSSFNLSQMPTTAAIRDAHANLNTSGSPLHPQRLFNLNSAMGAPASNGIGAGAAIPAHALSTQDLQQQAAGVCATPAGKSHTPARASVMRSAKGTVDESNDMLSSLERPARRLSAPLTYGPHSSNPSPGRLRYNPFLPRSVWGTSSGLTMRFAGDATTPLTVRSFLDDFCDLKEIGRGSFGRVFSCRRKIDLCQYAVKEINNEFRSERERERLLREIYALSTQGDNIHVVRYFNAWEQDDKIYIQTELCTGSLEHVRKRRGALPEDMLRDILVQVATGLAFMHAHNVAHLDGACLVERLHVAQLSLSSNLCIPLTLTFLRGAVKPENIYTTERGIYKLGDLGLASSISPRTHEDEGDKRYLSKELLQQQDGCDLFKADIFVRATLPALPALHMYRLSWHEAGMLSMSPLYDAGLGHDDLGNGDGHAGARRRASIPQSPRGSGADACAHHSRVARAPQGVATRGSCPAAQRS